MYSDADVAALYDVLNAWDVTKFRSDRFYTDMVMASASVLDVGCGTGSMLRQAREIGHTGRMAGLDPDPAMLHRARRSTDVEWVLAKAEDAAWDREFELVTLTSHAFQFLITDAEVRASLVAMRNALVDGGRIAFETRNPAMRAWDDWNPGNIEDVTDHDGRKLRVWHEIEAEVGDVITMTETTDVGDGAEPRVDRCQMRFLSAADLNRFLAEAGFAIESQHGDWSGSPLIAESPEIVTVARRT